MRLTYWIAECLNDSPVYSIRARRKMDVERQLEEQGEYACNWGKPRKIVVEYDDAFDLLSQCIHGEGCRSFEQ